MPEPITHKQDSVFVPNLCGSRAVFVLVLVAELFVLIQVLAFPATDGFEWNRLAETSLFVQWIVLCSAAAICWLRSFIQTLPPPAIALLILTIVLAITLSATLFTQWFWQDTATSSFPDWSQWFRHALIALIITAMLLRYQYVRFESSRHEVANANARLEALQARIRPHFLFNSMNIIASLIHIDPRKAEEAVEDLSDLFRSSLNMTSDRIALSKEIELCKGYLRIEQHRLGDRLQVEWRLHNLNSTLSIPPLTLQPIIENAVYHGIQPRHQGGTIGIDIGFRNDTVTIRIRNPVPDAGERPEDSGNRLAVDNIRSRLNLLYAGQASIDTHLTLHDGMEIFETIIHYPSS